MGVGHPIQSSFNGGLFGPRLGGRVDMDLYHSACQTLDNFIPTLQGPAVKRPGTRFISPAKYDDKMARLERFEFSQEQAYVLEFGDLYMRAHRNDATVLNSAQSLTGQPTATSPVVIPMTGHGYSNGQTVFITGTSMAEINNRFFTVSFSNPNDFSLDGENGLFRSTGVGGTAASVFELVTTYLEADVSSLQFEQSNDTLYVAHKSYAPTKITRTSDTAWTSTIIEGSIPPFNVENGDKSVTIVANATTGTAINLLATGGAPFTADMVGGWVKFREQFASANPKWQPAVTGGTMDQLSPVGVGDWVYNGTRVYECIATSGNTGFDPPVHDDGTFDDGGGWEWKYINDGYGYGKIVSVGGGGTTAVLDVDTAGIELPQSVSTADGGVATHRWSMGAWSDEYGYPASVAFFEDRLLWGGTVSSPQAVWGSAAGDYEDYSFEGENGKGLFFVLNSRTQNSIQWMRGEKVLFIGTEGGEFTLDGGNQEVALSKENFRLRSRSFYGTRQGSAALQVDNAILFSQRAGRKVHELMYDFDTDRYIAPDMTSFSEEVLDGIVKGMVSQHEPWRVIWLWMEDGTMASMTYVKEHEVIAWASHTLGGTDSKTLSMASIPHPDGDEDQVWMLVERTINGSNKRFIECMEKKFEVTDSPGSAFYLDSGLTVTASSLSTVFTGLDHLEGETVSILADSGQVPDKVVQGGSITIDVPAMVVNVGLGYEARMKTMRIEVGGRAGTAQGKTKRSHKMVIRLYETSPGIWFGSDFDRMDEVFFFASGDLMDTPIPYFNGDTERLPMPGGYSKDGTIAIKHIAPGPCNLLAIMPMFRTEEGL